MEKFSYVENKFEFNSQLISILYNTKKLSSATYWYEDTLWKSTSSQILNHIFYTVSALLTSISFILFEKFDEQK